VGHIRKLDQKGEVLITFFVIILVIAILGIILFVTGLNALLNGDMSGGNRLTIGFVLIVTALILGKIFRI
jgi:uncharacterized membrane protein (DUF485 family)